MPGRRRGRTGRGWDAAPPRSRRSGQSGQAGQTRPLRRRSADATQHPDPTESSATKETSGPTETGPTETGAAEPSGGEPSRAAERPGAHAESPESSAAGDPAERARQICLRQLSVRPRTRAELAHALRRHSIDDEVARTVLDRYHDVGMIDDAAFARAWVTSRHEQKGLAGRALGRELRRRGVDAETADEAVSGLEPETEEETARALVARKLRTTSGDPATVVRRLVGMLARKGYAPGLAYRVVKEMTAADPRTHAYAEDLDADGLADIADADGLPDVDGPPGAEGGGEDHADAEPPMEER